MRITVHLRRAPGDSASRGDAQTLHLAESAEARAGSEARQRLKRSIRELSQGKGRIERGERRKTEEDEGGRGKKGMKRKKADENEEDVCGGVGTWRGIGEKWKKSDSMMEE